MIIIWYITIHYDILYIQDYATWYITLYIYIYIIIYTYIYIYMVAYYTCITHHEHSHRRKKVGTSGGIKRMRVASAASWRKTWTMPPGSVRHRAVTVRWGQHGARTPGWMEIPRKHGDVSDLSKEHRISSDLLHFSWSSIKWFKQQNLTNIHTCGWKKSRNPLWMTV